MYCRQKNKTSVSYGMCYFHRCWIVFFFLANLISILGVNKGDLVKRGEKMLPTDIAFHRHTFGIPAKGVMYLNIVFFSTKAQSTKSVVISNTSFEIRSLQTVTNAQEIFVFIS